MRMIAKIRAGVVVAAALLGSLAVAGHAQAAGTSAGSIDVAALSRSAPVPISQAVARLQSLKALRANAPAATLADCQAVTITSAANNRYVSAEFGWSGDRYGMLRARATVEGPWEEYGLCNYGSGYVIASLVNGNYVSTELGWSGDNYGMLRARATAIGPWEQYAISQYGSNITIRSLANNKYVSTELGWSGDRYGMLRGRASSIGPWEQYY